MYVSCEHSENTPYDYHRTLYVALRVWTRMGKWGCTDLLEALLEHS